MKVSNWAILLAMTGSLAAATAFAQSGLRQPGQVAPVGFEYGSYDYYAAQEPAAPSPSDAPAPPPAPVNGQMEGHAMGARRSPREVAPTVAAAAAIARAARAAIVRAVVARLRSAARWNAPRRASRGGCSTATT